MPPRLVPISCAIRWRISAAALLVNVTAIIEYGEQFSTLCSRDTVNQHARLTTARSSQYQQVCTRGGNRVTLFIIKAVEQVRNVHWHRHVMAGRQMFPLAKTLLIYTEQLMIISAS